MWKIAITMIIVGLLVTMLPLTTLGGQVVAATPERVIGKTGQEITFPDQNLEGAIRKAIGKPKGPIYTTDLEGLTELDATGWGITNLAGLEHCTNLEELDLEANQISDISPLSNLTNLEDLDLAGNQISDISPLSNLTNLEDLDLAGNQISDISPLSNLTNLEELDLRGNPLNDTSIEVYILQLEKRGVEVSP